MSTWRRALLDVMSSPTSCQRCAALVRTGERLAMVQLHGGDSQVEPWCMTCLIEEVTRCSELMLVK